MGKGIPPQLADLVMDRLKMDKTPFPQWVEPGDSKWWLNPRNKQVCDYFLTDAKLHAKQAYDKFYGPHKNNGALKTASYAFFKKVKVRRYLYVRIKEIQDETQLSQEFVIRNLMEIGEMAMGRKKMKIAIPDPETGEMVQHEVYNTDLRAARSTYEWLGKFNEIGMWTEKPDKEISGVTIQINTDTKATPLTGKILEVKPINEG